MDALYLLLISLVGLQCACARLTYIDMTYKLTNTTIKWPGHKGFNLVKVWEGPYQGVLDWLAMYNIDSAEHIGTHMDSPYHFYKYGYKLDEIPFRQLHGPAVVINIERRAEMDRDAMAYAYDLKAWETRNGRIPDGAYILLNSGWGKYWGDQIKAVGSKNDTSNLHYPGFSEDAAKWIAKYRPGIAAVGSDTISCDNGATTTFPVHVLLQKMNILCLENVANIQKIPESGAEVFAMPMKYSGSGSPIRMYAVLGKRDEFPITVSEGHAPVAMMWYCYAVLAIFFYTAAF